ncbi:hypothetical protein DAPPUDRAFT_318493 [Daphnia pulex]|uniref:Uncharacterized protein n=1 Tax=Daphnia pulex TaxID=6669 RepID=E9GJ06_DAPPU|nr:hypothetical protein DAPPUDRAFT_318493 [Daphnia pulex]|eukprot:EFX80360.1 hypothetical protein DAPPUDRAFT_318493 [Daphnia pulex]
MALWTNPVEADERFYPLLCLIVYDPVKPSSDWPIGVKTATSSNTWGSDPAIYVASDYNITAMTPTQLNCRCVRFYRRLNLHQSGPSSPPVNLVGQIDLQPVLTHFRLEHWYNVQVGFAISHTGLLQKQSTFEYNRVQDCTTSYDIAVAQSSELQSSTATH